MIFISPADFSINFLKPIDLENKLYYVKLYVYNEHISTLLDKVKVISIWETPDIAELREPESDNVV